jgi:hypothetical protein
MEFIDYIIKNGCSIKCFYEQKMFYNQPYLSEICPLNNPQLVPGLLDNKFALLISVLMVKFMDDVYQPFYYNNQYNTVSLLINGNELINFKLPEKLSKLIDNIKNCNDDLTFINYKNDILNEIREQIDNLLDNQMIDRFNKLINMQEETHILKVIRDNKKHKIGVGKIFRSE